MEQVWLDALIANAERAADAAIRLLTLKVDALLTRISEARRANDDQSREAAYNNLQNELAPVLRALSPITLDDLQDWRMNQGFCHTRLRSVSFWLLSVSLLILVGWLTSLYDRASSLAQQMEAAQHSRLSEQAVKLFDVAREHTDEITTPQTNGQQTLASETFFRTLGDLLEAQSSLHSLVVDSQEITHQINFLSRQGYNLCLGARFILGIVNAAPECVDPELEYVPPALQLLATSSYGSTPPADLANQLKAAHITPEVGAAANTGEAAPVDSPELDKVYGLMDGADSFFNRVGLVQVGTRLPPPLSAVTIQPIKAALSALQSWILPFAYGSLGAAIFFTRRFLNTALPNPDVLRVIYRILFGGFAGIVFAWFWTPMQAQNSTIPLSSLSAFGIAFLAGYGTDVLFQLLDRLVEAASAQIRKTPA